MPRGGASRDHTSGDYAEGRQRSLQVPRRQGAVGAVRVRDSHPQSLATAMSPRRKESSPASWICAVLQEDEALPVTELPLTSPPIDDIEPQPIDRRRGLIKRLIAWTRGKQPKD